MEQKIKNNSIIKFQYQDLKNRKEKYKNENYLKTKEILCSILYFEKEVK